MLLVFLTILILSISILTPFYIDDVGRIVKDYGAEKLREERAIHEYMMGSLKRELTIKDEIIKQGKDDAKILRFFFLETDEKRKQFDEFLKEEDIDY